MIKAKKGVKKSAPKKTSPKKAPAKRVVPKKAAVKKNAAKKVVSKAITSAKPKGFSEEMLAVALKVLDERQADQIVTIPLAGRSALADYMILASGRAGRQVVAIADHLREAFFKIGVRTVRVEGKEDANWVLIDAGDIIIHLFLPEVRRYYDLDTLWNKKTPRK